MRLIRPTARLLLWQAYRSKYESFHTTTFHKRVETEEEKELSGIKTKRLHQPLGVYPEGTSLEEVREKWQSDAMELISKVPPIVVDGYVAACNGGGGPLGHPIEYIRLEAPYPATCKYCGLRYINKHTFEKWKKENES
ncbi:NADH dehydrogenase [ubiquinone] iron-sulfur protein 6, mitochondrial [Galdieria sulphuraria]|nr:NADH dehydrogenase [ubiquinone] iron-sulfur protein 6, mitochondrial [Galdieria sulphuraria]